MVTFQIKPHYLLLDALRGVAALLVMWYHVFEAFATSPFDQRFNHGYLAVDFFFVLSGFVIGYAYDDRWEKMGTTHFFKRRLIRLHPMVVAGALIGLIAYMAQGCVTWNGTPVDLQWVVVAWLLSMFLLLTFPQTWHIALTVIAVSILTAYIILKCYDDPMRKHLTQRWLRREEE